MGTRTEVTKDFREASLTRQLDVIPMAVLGAQIHIIGAGAIGSWVALSLAKMGLMDITVYDHDTVSVENMNCQFYPIKDIDRLKVDALQEMVEMFTGTRIQVRPAKYTGEKLRGIVISALDNMETRKIIFDNCKDSATWIVDPRMSLEAASLFVCNTRSPKVVEEYSKTFYSDSDAVQERCTAKSTIFTANLIAGLVCKTVKDIITENQEDKIRNLEIHVGRNKMLAWGQQSQMF